MILTLNSSRRIAYLLWFIVSTLTCIVFFGPNQSVHAQTSQMLSVTPPLFQLSVEPSSTWPSVLKVVNGNEFPLTVYAEVVNFSAQGESGSGMFIPISESGNEGTTLAEWISFNPGPYVIEPLQTSEIPFSIAVPQDASPGGHFAAMLVSTDAPKVEGEPVALRTSQGISSLFFVRVEGEIIERGDIREFSVTRDSIELPEANFSLRFENKGNVHLQPRGNIVIRNMWGKERGVIPINSKTHFGNVLPGSIRNFEFAWKGERTITDIGRYSAEVSLAYGTEGSMSAVAMTYFWVIPIKATLITIASIALFVYAIILMVRMYVRRMLMLAGVDITRTRTTAVKEPKPFETVSAPVPTKRAQKTRVTAPLVVGAREFRNQIGNVRAFMEVVRAVGAFVLEYKFFFISLAVLIVGFIASVLYISDVSQSSRSYEVRIVEDGADQVLTDDEIPQVLHE